jgi:Ni,Fe-hydrogenase III small subunit
MERHHLPTHCVAGICDLVASGGVWQEEKIKTAGLETSVPLEEEPAGCQRSDKRKAMERHHPWWHRETCGRKKR